MLLVILIVILAIIGIFLAVFYFVSSGKPQKIKDKNGRAVSGSISEIIELDLGNAKQYIIVRGEDETKPVLLFLHGGPGDPEFTFIKKFAPELQKYFVLVHWDQRGAGKSFSSDLDPKTMNVKQLTSDGNELVEYLKNRFKRQKVYLMGHSWGTVLGMNMIKEHPENFFAYMGIGQVANILKGEKISQRFVIDRLNEDGNKRAAEKIENYNLDEMDAEEFIKYLFYQRKFVRKYGGAMRNIKIGKAILSSLFAREYTVGEKINIVKGEKFSIKNLWGEIMENNLDEQILEVGVPVYIFQGKYDYQTPYKVAREYYEKLKAPEKEFFTFENSAHCPLFEENKTFNKLILEKVLKD